MRNNYFGLNYVFFVELFVIIVVNVFAIAMIIGYCNNTITEPLAIYVAALWLLLSIGVALNYSCPVIMDDCMEMRWLFFPFLNKRFRYDEIDHVLFLRKVTYGAHYTMTVFCKKGRKDRYGDLLCMPYKRLQELIDDLRDHGVEIDNQLRVTDIK